VKYISKFNESFQSIESGLFNIVLQCINDSFENNIEQLYTEFKDCNTKESQINFIYRHLNDDDKKDLGRFFINNYLFGNNSRELMYFIYNKINPEIKEILNNVWKF